MRRREKTGGKAAKTQRTGTLKRRNAPKVARHRGSSSDDLSKIALFKRERDEALEQLAATNEVLKIVSRSTSNLSAALDMLLETACRLCEADIGTIRYEEGVGYRLAATFGCQPEWHKHFAGYSTKPDRSSVFGQTILKGSTVHIRDVLEDPDYARPQAQKLTGLRAALGVPLMRDRHVFGVVNLFRTSPRAFTQNQIDMVETFAAQATIAIENARLLNELRQRTDDLSEALEQQTATSEVLKVISSSPTNVQPVFDSIAESAARLCDGQFSFVVRFDGKAMEFANCWGLSTEGLATFQSILPMPASEDTAAGRAILRRAVVEIPDVWADSSYGARSQGLAKTVTYRSIAAVPLLQEGNPIGAIAVARRLGKDPALAPV